MRPSKAAAFGAAAAVFAVLLFDSPASAAPSTSGELDALRQDCIAAARDAQQHERAISALEHTIELLSRDAQGRQRGLDESRPEQARLLGTLAYLAHDPPERPTFAPIATIERVRGEMLLQGTLPELRAEARALAGEIERIAVLREQIAGKNSELASARQARDADRGRLAELTARRLEVTRRILPEDNASAGRITKLGREPANPYRGVRWWRRLA